MPSPGPLVALLICCWGPLLHSSAANRVAAAPPSHFNHTRGSCAAPGWAPDHETQHLGSLSMDRPPGLPSARRRPFTLRAFAFWLGPWLPLAVYFSFLLVGAVLWRALCCLPAVDFGVGADLQEHWGALMPPDLALIHPLRYVSAWALIAVGLSCCFPLALHHYAPRGGSRRPVDCPKDWVFFGGRCFTFLSEGAPNITAAQAACMGRGGGLAQARTAREDAFLKDLVLSVGQFAGGFRLEEGFRAPQATYGTQVWHSFDAALAPHSRCTNPLVVGGCPALCERPPETEPSAFNPRQFGEAALCSVYYATVLLVLFHPPVERLLCNEYILWVQNGHDPEAWKGLSPEWLVQPSCGIVLLSMLQNRTFTRRPYRYLLARALGALALLVLTLRCGAMARAAVWGALPPAALDRWQHRVAPGARGVQRMMIGLITDSCLLPFFYLIVLKLEALRQQREVVAKEGAESATALPVERGTEGEGGPACRICHDSSGALIQACACRGSMAFAHAECLNRWRNYTPSRGQCDVCRQPYALRPVPFTARQVLWVIACAGGAVVARVAACLGGLLGVLGTYTQGAILFVLSTRPVRIHFLGGGSGPADFHFELPSFPVRRGATEEPEMPISDHILFLLGCAFYVPLIVVWSTQCLRVFRRHVSMGGDAIDTADALIITLRILVALVAQHVLLTHAALAWPTLVLHLGPLLPTLRGPVDLRRYLLASYALALLPTASLAGGLWAWQAGQALHHQCQLAALQS